MDTLESIGLAAQRWTRSASDCATEIAAWQFSEPAAAGFNSSKLDALARTVAESDSNIHSVLIVRGGSIAFERYFAGDDACMGFPLGRVDAGPDTLHDLRSVTKSIVGAVVGIAHGTGAIPDLDAPLASFFPDYRDGREQTLDSCTVRHALTMTAGLVWDEQTYPYTDPRNDEHALWAADDPLQYALSRPQVAAPGSRFGYNGGLPTVLASVVERATGVDFASYAQEHLWCPLGVSQVEWIVHRSGLVVAASGLRLTARDMARFGQMIVDRGRVAGQQIVPAGFVADSLAAHVQTEAEFLPAEYGYLWWIAAPFPVASGNGGQRILVDSNSQMVIVITAGKYDLPDQADAPLRVMGEIFGAMI